MGNKKNSTTNNTLEKFWLKKIYKEPIIHIKKLEGGVSSDVYKVQTNSKTYCIKRSLPKLRVLKEWFADTKRLRYEYLWLKHCKKIIPNSIPNIYQFSAKQDFLILEYLNEKNYTTLKSKLLNKDIDINVINKISKNLSKIHNESTGKFVKKKFINNSKNFYDLRLDAYFNEVGRVYPHLKKIIKNIIKNYEKYSSTLVHGDFSPKNILIFNKNIKYIDAETCNFGDPAFDVVYFCNHLLLKSIHIPDKKNKFIKSYENFFNTYLKSIKFSQRKNFIDRCIAMVPIMLLARIDGKSPVEYITKKNIKNKIRLLSFNLINDPPESLEYLIKMIK